MTQRMRERRRLAGREGLKRPWWIGFILVVWCLASLGSLAWAAPEPGGSMEDAAKPAKKPRLSLKQLEQAVKAHVVRQVAGKGLSVTVRVLAPRMPPIVPGTVTALEVLPDRLSGRTGRRPYLVAVRTGSRVALTLNVVADVRVRGEAVFPTRMISRGQVVSTEDLILKPFELPSIHTDVVRVMEEVVGKQVARVLQPNQPIRRAFVNDPPVVKKGDRVMIVARSQGLLVRTVGVAEAAGTRGQTIVVLNPDSGRKIHGVVARSGVVEVTF